MSTPPPAQREPEPGQLTFPEIEEGLVELVRRKSFVHTGAFVSRDEELCRAVCTELLTGLSRRVIASRHGISRNTVNSIREVMEARGEMEPLKKEIARRLDRCVIYSLENLEEAMAKGMIAPGQLPIATAVLLDKKAALDGLPTARIEHVTARKVTHEELNAWLDSLPSANPTPAGLASGAGDPLSLALEAETAAPQPQPEVSDG